MGDTSEERLLSSIRKAAGFVAGIVTGPEFVNAVRAESAHAQTRSTRRPSRRFGRRCQT